MRFRLLVQEFLPVAMILAILAGLYHFDLGIVRAVVGSWADVLGIHADASPHAMPLLLDDGVCFAVLVLVMLVASWVVPLEDACSRLMARIKGIRVNEHIAMPISLTLLVLATRYLGRHDTDTVRGAVILATDGLKWLVMRIDTILSVLLAIPLPKPEPPCLFCVNRPDTLPQLPLDAICLGFITAAFAFWYVDDLHRSWLSRKPSTSAPLPATQEL